MFCALLGPDIRLVDSERPGKQFFSHVGTEPPLPGYYQYF